MGNITSLEERRRRRDGENRAHSVRETRVVYKKTIDYLLLVPVILLIALGLVMVFSSSYYASEYRNASSGSSEYFFIKQFIFVAAGFVFMLGLAHFDYHRFYCIKKNTFNAPIPMYKRTYFWILVLGFVLSVLVFVPGIGSSTNDSSRWIRVFGITLMPAEPMKAAMIIYMGCDIGANPRKVMRFSRNFLPYVGVWAAICVITYFQRNFSAIICYTLLFLSMIFVGGFDIKQLLVVIGIIGAGLILIMFFASYRVDRISSWINVLKETLGLPYDEVDRDKKWQVQQSLYAIGTGGLFGKGLGNSIQKYLWLSLGETDFIFAIIAEELGLFGCICVIGLYAYIIWRGVKIAQNAPDLTGKLLATGVTAIFAIQVVLNIGVATSVLPNTGVVLPFVSYGGTSVVIFMCMMGILLNVSKQGVATPPLKLIRNDNKERRNVQTQEDAPKRAKRENPAQKSREWKI